MKIRQLDLQSLLYQVNGLSVDHQIAMRVIRALENNALEIEGYERSEWMCFNPNDPKTYPPKGWFLGYVAGTIVQLLRHPEETDEYFANKFSIKNHLTHWRPLPKPPVETEKN